MGLLVVAAKAIFVLTSHGNEPQALNLVKKGQVFQAIILTFPRSEIEGNKCNKCIKSSPKFKCLG